MRLRGAAALVLLLPAACVTPTPTSRAPRGELYAYLQVEFQAWTFALHRANEQLDDVELRIRNLANRHVDVLMRDLQLSGETEYRTIAAFALGLCTTKKDTLLPVLIQAMDDGSPFVRANAAVSVGRLGPQIVPVEAYRRLLADPHPHARHGALWGLRWALRDGDDRGLLPDLHGRLFDQDVGVRREAAAVVAMLARPESLEPIAELWRQGERDPAVLINCADALKNIRDERAIEPLIDMLRHPNHDVVVKAWYALTHITGMEFDRQWHSWANWWREEQDRRRQAGGPP